MDRLLSFETIIVLAAAAVGIWILVPFGTAILLAAITAYILHPLVSTLRRYLKFYDIALILSLAIIVAPAVAFLNYIAGDITPLINAVSGISDMAGNAFAVLGQYASQYGLEHYFQNIPQLIDKLELYAKTQLKNVLINAPHMAISAGVYLLATYYLLKDGVRISGALTRYAKSLPKRDEEAVRNLVQGLKNSFDVLFFSYVAMSLLVTLLAWGGYAYLGVPSAGIFALLTGLFAFLPLVGTWVGYGLTALYTYAVTETTSMPLAVLVFGVLVLSLLPEFILKPIIGSRVGNVHPLTILLGFFGGPVIFGIKGFLLGPILLVIAETVVAGYVDYCIAVSRDRTQDVPVTKMKVT